MMKRNVTKLMAALALLAIFIAPLGMRGQSKATGDILNETFETSSTTANDWTFNKVSGHSNGYALLDAGSAYNGSKGLHLGSGSNAYGSATTPTLSGMTTEATMTFYAKTNTNNHSLKLSATGCTIDKTSITIANGTWTQYTVNITNGTSSAKINFYKDGSTKKYIYIDDVVITSVSVTPSFTITAESNNDSWGTVDLSGTTITATPNDGYRVIAGNGGYTVTTGTATVTNNGDNTFTVTPSSDCTVQINFEAIPTHTVTFSVNGTTSTQDFAEDAAITFPEDPASTEGKVFMGWTATEINGTQPNAPTYVTSATMGNSDVTFYAVFASVTPGTGVSTSMTISATTSGVPSSYGTANTFTEYTLNGKKFKIQQMYKNGAKLQWRAAGNSNGTGTMYNSEALQNLQSIVLNYDSSDSNKNFTVKVGAAENPTNGTSIEPSISGDTYTFDCSNGNYDYFVLTNGSSAGYLTSIVINYIVSAPDTYSDYCTTVGAIITVNPDAIELAADELEGTTGITFANLEITEPWEDCHVTFYDATGTTVVAQPDWVIEALVAEDNDAYLLSCAVYANEGPARTAYFKVYAYDENDNAVYSNLVTLSQTGYVMPSTAETWELTTLSELTADDVFVIVGTIPSGETYALPYSNGSSSAPAVVAVTIDNDMITSTVDPSIQWNISGDATNGYVFYPNGDNENWLYCTSSNDGVRVGTNTDKTFTFVSGGNAQANYLYNVANSRYVGIYITSNGSGYAQDWRCYGTATNNIKDQSFAFYKKVAAPTDTNTKTIQPYNSTYDHYYLIASPVMAVEPSVENGFLANNYDLYRFDQSHEDEEWLNYEVTPFYLLSGKGYLYANSGNNGNATTITFTGVPYNGNGEVTLSKVPNVKFSGWNLIGNPWNATAILKDDNNQDQAYYTINQTNNEVAAGALGTDISAMEGVFVVAEEDGDVVTFAKAGGVIGTLPEIPDEPGKKGALNLNISKPQGLVIDRAIVRFDNGGQLPKFQLNPNNTKIYFTEDNKDFAVVRSANEGEMPVNFRAAENGTYSLSVEVSDTEMAYLHLIDNKTGVDVDLLANPSYTFEANANDYESRFRLVFNATGVEENNTNETFAFFNGSEWVVNTTGNATLQVVDMMGRVLSSEQINGNTAVNLNQAAGIYVLRLVNGENVMVQKVVVR